MIRRNVYFVRAKDGSGPIKIGCSTHPDGRAFGLGVWSPFPLEVVHQLPGDTRLERRFHDYFADELIHREWFQPSDRLLAAIDALKAGEAVDDVLRTNAPPKPHKLAKRNISPERAEFMAARSRVSGLEARMRNRGHRWFETPRDIRQTIDAWRRGTIPTDEQKARIKAFIAENLAMLKNNARRAA